MTLPIIVTTVLEGRPRSSHEPGTRDATSRSNRSTHSATAATAASRMPPRTALRNESKSSVALSAMKK